MQRWAPVRLVRITASQSSIFMRRAIVSRVMAALLTRISSLPNLARTCWNPVLIWAASATSMGTARASPPADSISVTRVASFSVLRAATATFAPEAASPTAVARPIPCDAPVMSATLSFSENIRSNFLVRSALGFAGFGARLGDFLQRVFQAGGIFHVENADATIDLAQQAGQNFAGADFDEDIHAGFDHFVNRIEPTDRRGDLADQRVAGFVAGDDGFGIDIGDQRKFQGGEAHGFQIGFEAFLCRHHQRAVKRRGDGQNHGALSAGL